MRKYRLPALHHLAEVERLLRERRPASLQGHLEQSSAETSRRLLHVRHVRDQGVPLKLQLADVRLEEGVHLERKRHYDAATVLYQYS